MVSRHIRNDRGNCADAPNLLASDRPDCHHDHCEFCWVHFGDQIFDDDEGTQLEGWATLDGKHWVCRAYFEDFRQRFEFETVTPAP